MCHQSREKVPSLLSRFKGQHTVVVEQLLDEVDVGQHHAAAAVSLQSEGIKGVTMIQIKSIKNERRVRFLFL